MSDIGERGSLPNVYASEDYLVQLLAKAVAAKASDIHLKVGQPPGARIRGEIVYFRAEPLLPADTHTLATHIIHDDNVKLQLDHLTEYDAAYSAKGVGRFRVNIFRQRGSLAIVMRTIPFIIPTFDQLGCPAACLALCEKERGLVLVVGAAGNGKSSTIAAMIGHLNGSQALHIVTVEDPIEFLHRDEKASVSQREVGIDTHSFADALRAALRQDPDVILVGEIRDEETMDIALKAAETGHLVLSSLHTPGVSRTMNRMLSLMKGQEPDEVRERIGDSLQGIIAQRLLPRADGAGVVLAAEVLVATGTVREAIKRPENNPPLKELMERGVHPYGMQTYEMAIKQLVTQGIVEKEVGKQAAGF
jgi:twitching motility protein PilT